MVTPDHDERGDVDLLEIARRRLSRPHTSGVRPMRRIASNFGLPIAAVLALIIVVGASSKRLAALLHPNPAVPHRVQPAKAREVSAVALSRAFRTGPAEAEAKYGNKTLIIDATVQSKAVDLGSRPILELHTGTDIVPVQATFRKAYSRRIATVMPGTQVTIRCKALEDFMDAPLLSACSLSS